MSLSQLEEYIETGNGRAIDSLLNGNPGLSKQKTSHDISPLLLACYYNKPQIVKILLKHLDELTIHEAAAASQLEQVQAMIENQLHYIDVISEHDISTLVFATHFGNEAIVHFLVAKHADPNVQSKNGYNVYPLHAAISANFDRIAKMLIYAGAEINVLQA